MKRVSGLWSCRPASGTPHDGPACTVTRPGRHRQRDSTCYRMRRHCNAQSALVLECALEVGLDENIDGRTLNAEHPFRSMLAGRTTAIDLPCESDRKRLFNIRAAQTTRERRSASSLLSRMYATRGYEGAHLADEECELAKTFLASDHDSAIGTLTIGLDSSSGLKLEPLFPDEVDRFRDAGHRICEFTKLAMDRRARSPRLLASMFHVAYIYAHRVKNLTHLLIEVNPRHVRYYETMLGFKLVAAARHNPRVNAPAVLLALDLCHAEEQIRRFGGKPELSAVERSAYPHFFSSKDEAGIIGRLCRCDEDIAHVFELDAVRAAEAGAAAPLH
ncbi:MAG TPA: hypothetical protein PLO07_05685 [Rubrivivax sp.]|nr:hypothetical protein [Rubrivivax sp.]